MDTKAEIIIKFEGKDSCGQVAYLTNVNGGQLIVSGHQLINDCDETIEDNGIYEIKITYPDPDKYECEILTNSCSYEQILAAGYFLRLKGEAMMIASIYQSEEQMARAYADHRSQPKIVLPE